MKNHASCPLEKLGWGLGLLLVWLVVGCSSDHRLVELAREGAQRQGEQNQQMGQIVSQEAGVRKQFGEIHSQLQGERAVLSSQRDALEGDRREIAQQRARDPVVASAIGQLGIVLACLAPIVLALVLFRGASQSSEQENLSELLLTELTSPTPTLLPPPQGPHGYLPQGPRE